MRTAGQSTWKLLVLAPICPLPPALVSPHLSAHPFSPSCWEDPRFPTPVCSSWSPKLSLRKKAQGCIAFGIYGGKFGWRRGRPIRRSPSPGYHRIWNQVHPPVSLNLLYTSHRVSEDAELPVIGRNAGKWLLGGPHQKQSPMSSYLACARGHDSTSLPWLCVS